MYGTLVIFKNSANQKTDKRKTLRIKGFYEFVSLLEFW